MYFWANDVIHGRELWVSDGTLGGTNLVLDIYPGLTGSTSFDSNPVVYNNAIYFIARDDVDHYLWMTDGTAGGTTPVSQQSLVTPYNYFEDPFNEGVLNVVDNHLYFPGINEQGIELWKSDGTLSGTTSFNETCAGDCWTSDGYRGYQSGFYFDGDHTIYFAADDTTHGTEPWILDLNTVEINSGISDRDNCSISPNPAFDFFTIKIQTSIEKCNVEVMDMLGQRVRSIETMLFQKEIRVDCRDILPGIYHVVLSNHSGQILYRSKVILQ